ncbi:MAG: thermostable hemolysin [Proteobacteria bacterium]|nr:thermostable hemolysin [Pseudomonadota bacterium]
MRPSVETFISDIYVQNYDANLKQFSPTLVALLDGDAVVCAASLRFAVDGFFSEHYLDEPIERTLSRLSKAASDREKIFEVGTLASAAPIEAPRFIRQIVSLGVAADFDWAVFTATRRLRRLLGLIGLPLLQLADARRSCVPAAQDWGTYYATDPEVLAVNRLCLAMPAPFERGMMRA